MFYPLIILLMLVLVKLDREQRGEDDIFIMDFGNHVIRPQLSRVREVIDPYQKLPVVHLVPDAYGTEAYQEFVDEEVTAYTIRESRTIVGSLAVSSAELGNDYHFAHIALEEEFREPRRGLGLATYLLAIEQAHSHGVPFACDSSVSPEAKHRWEHLISIGLAQVAEPFHVLPTTPPARNTIYTGYVWVPPLF